MERKDFDEASVLLGIIEKQVTVAPMHTYIASAAWRRLKELDDAAKEESEVIAEEERQARVEEEAAIAAKQSKVVPEEDKPRYSPAGTPPAPMKRSI